MVENQNTAIVDRMSDDIKEGNIAALPKNIQSNIQPCLIINPPTVNDIARTNVTEADNNSQTVFTTPQDRQFYLSNASISAMSVASSGTVSLTCVINGATQTVLKIGIDDFGKSTNLGGQMNILVDRNTPINVISDTADVKGWASIIGYTKIVLRK